MSTLWKAILGTALFSSCSFHSKSTWNVGLTPGAEPGHSCSFYSVLLALPPRCRTVGVQGVVVEDSLGTSEVSGVQVLFASLPSLSQEISLVTAFNPGLSELFPGFVHFDSSVSLCITIILFLVFLFSPPQPVQHPFAHVQGLVERVCWSRSETDK